MEGGPEEGAAGSEGERKSEEKGLALSPEEVEAAVSARMLRSCSFFNFIVFVISSAGGRRRR